MGRRATCGLSGLAVGAALLSAACGGQPQPRPRPPSSIVLITIDTLRADHVNARLTPALAALARDAVVFDQAVTVAPLTLPAHASLLTGAYPPRHTVRDNQLFALPGDVPTFPALLKACGYATAAFVSAAVLDHRFGLNRGFDLYDDEIAGPERPAGETLARAERWLDAASRPFFVWIHLFEPHAPYLTGSYASEVTAADNAIAGLMTHLHDIRIWNDVVLSVTSDHGEALGEHGEQTHGFFLYDATLRIPWILKAPDLPPRHVPYLVRIVDELPTVLDVARSADPGPSAGSSRGASGAAAATDGISLAEQLTRADSPNLEAYSETFLPRDQFGWSQLTSIRTGQFKYIEAPEPELYDLTADAGESTNIVKARVAEAGRFQRVLGAMARASTAPPRRAGSDPALTETLMSLGYLGASGPFADTGMPLADPKSKLEVYTLTMTALELSERGDVPGALGALAKAERIDPNVAQLEFLKGTLLGQVGRFTEAVTAFERTLALNPRYTAARFKLALAWLRIGRSDRADDALHEVVRQQPEDFRAWHNLAAIEYSRGDLNAAESLERRALAISPDYAEAWATLGAIALVRKRPEAAIDALTKATGFAPRNAQAFENLSLALRAAGQHEKARAAADRACALEPRFCPATGGRP